MNEAGIKVTPSNRKQIDRTIHDIAEVAYKDCPATWRKLKQEILVEEQKRQDFIKKLQNAEVETN